MYKSILLFFACVFLFMGCDGYNRRQYVVRPFSLEDQKTALAVLSDMARAPALAEALLEEVSLPTNTPNYFAYYERNRKDGGFSLWIDARIHGEDMVIELHNFPNFTPPPAYNSVDAWLSRELSETFGERLTIDPKPAIPYPKKKAGK